MKKNVWYVMLLMAAMFAGCAAERDGQNAAVNNGKASVNPDSIPVAFDGYQNRATSRSGWAGVFDNDQLKETKANGGGFGVFAYYTDLKKYDQTYVPNFMYNQGVFWNGEDGTLTGDYFAYSPIMYWPNEYGFDASSDDEDHVTFFAYAPFVESASAAAGSVSDATYGITGFSRNTATGDPMVKYIASFDPEKSVDLCWGVVPADKTSWPKIQGGGTMTLTEGLPWLDMERPLETATQAGASSTSRIKFKFNHALAQLNVQIDTDADITTHTDSGDELADGTKVYVRSISFSGIALKGALNLNNTVKDQALWLDYSCTTDLAFGQSVTVHDGRRDSREGVQGAEAANETPTGLNPDIIQNSTMTPGVTHEYQNLFAPTSPIAIPGSPTPAELAARLEDAICVIPTGESMTITIVYDIEMEDSDLTSYLSDGKTHGLSIENKVTKTVSFGGVAGAGLESNKRYALKLHLGMNSVKFDAEVSDWATNTVNGEGWLPSNVRPITLNHTVMYLGAAQNLIATTDPTGQSVTWTNSDPSVVTLGGLVASSRGGTRAVTTLPGTWSTVSVTPVALGDATITASLASGDKAVCEVHVVPIVLTSPNNTDPGNAITETVGRNATVQLQASLFPASSPASGVTWTASPAGIVTLTSPVGGDYTKCDVTGNAVGDVVITAQNGTYPTTATCNMSVTSQPPTVTTPSLTANWTYDTNAHDLIATAGGVIGGTMSYSLDGSSWYTTYNDAALKATNAGNYPVYYKIDGDPGYDDVPATLIGTVLVSKATPTITLSATSGNVFERGRINTFTASTSSASEGSTLSVSSSNTSKANASISSGTVTVTGVSSGSATVTVTSTATTNYNAGSATYTATVDPLTKDMNPLWYVAYYNANSNTSYTFGTSITDNFFFYWNGAMSSFTGATTTYDSYQVGNVTMTNGPSGVTWHMPSRSEFLSIVPAYTMANNILTKTGTISNNVVFGYDTSTKGGITDNSYVVHVSATESHVIRYLGTDFCSAWKYEIIGSGTANCYARISSIMIDYIADATEAASWYTANWSSISFAENDSQCASIREFYCHGYATSPGSTASDNTRGYYWTTSATIGDTSKRSYFFVSDVRTGTTDNYICIANDAYTAWTASLRLFRDN